MQPFDIFIASAPKDYIKLPFVVKSIAENIQGFENIYIITPDKVNFKSKYSIISFKDTEILPNINPMLWRFRPNWILQQFIKLFQDVTKNDYYLTVDSDVIINRPLPLFENDNPIWYMGFEQNEAPYYRFQEKMLGYGRVYDHTFLADMNFLNKKIIKEILLKSNYTLESFINASYDVIDVTCHPSEADIFGNFVMKYYPDLYILKNLKQDVHGKHINNSNQIAWSKEEIEEIIYSKKSMDVDVHSLHSWCMHFENKW